MRRLPYNVLYRHLIGSLVFFVTIIFAASVRAQPLQLDTSFGNGGRLIIPSPGFPNARFGKIFVQPGGRIVAVGSQSRPGLFMETSGIGMIGLDVSGAFDPTFAAKGRYTDWSSAASNSYLDSEMLPDGSIVVFSSFNYGVTDGRVLLTKFTPAGSIDTTFNANLDVPPDRVFAVAFAVAASGKIYVIVSHQGVSSHSIIRLNPNGSRDASFAPNGIKRLELGRLPNRWITHFSVLPNGRLVVLGKLSSTRVFFAARLDENANFDRSFGLNGIVRLSYEYADIHGNDVVLQPDGKIVVAGCFVELGSLPILVRLTNRGKLDQTFGIGGIVTHGFGYSLHCANQGVLRSDGTIVVVGYAGQKSLPSPMKFMVVAFDRDGRYTAGAFTNFPNAFSASAESVYLTHNGKILVAGSAGTRPNSSFAISRYDP